MDSPAKIVDLDGLLQEYRCSEFQYGKNDCALFASDCVLLKTGIDYAEGFRNRYTTRIGGLRVLRRAGYKDHVDFVSKNLAEIPRSFAKTGDIAAVLTGNSVGKPALGVALGVVVGAYVFIWFGVGNLRPKITPIPIINIFRAFKV